MRTSRSPTTVMTANGEVQIREEATVFVKELDLIRDGVASWRNTRSSFTREALRGYHGYTYHWTSGQKAHLTKNGKRIDWNICVPFVVPGLSTSSSNNIHTYFFNIFIAGFCIWREQIHGKYRNWKKWKYEWGLTVKPAGQTFRNQKQKIKMKDAKRHRAIYCMTCRTGCRSSEKIRSMKVVLWSHGETLRLRIETLPVLLMNYEWSREQKWNRGRASTAFILTSRNTQIVKSAWRRKWQGLLAGDLLVQSYTCRTILGNLISADHKILSEGSESRNNHRCAVVVQDLATQWLQSYPCKTKTSQETQKS